MVLFDGQSLNYSPAGGITYPQLLMRDLGIPVGGVVGESGRSWTVLAGSVTNRYTWVTKHIAPKVVVFNGGQSDVLSPEANTGAVAFADLIAYIDWLRALDLCDYAIVTTMGALGGAYVADRPADIETARLGYNERVRIGAASIDEVVDLAAIPQLQNPLNASYYSDGVHYTAAAAVLAADALRPAIQRGIASVLAR